jgi:hypothetical protein
MVNIPSPGGIPMGKLPSRNPQYEDMTRRRSLRESRTGDDPRRINWKASKKVPGTILVNEYEAAISYPLVVFLNLDPYEYPLQKRELWFERAIEAAAALCLMAARDRQDLGIILYPTCTLIRPSPFTLLPILERLAAIKRPQGPEGNQADPASVAIDPGALRGSSRAMLDQGKRLPYGTRLVYAGPELPEEDYIALNTLRAYHLSLEYLALDERRLSPQAPGNTPRYQMREGGYDII